jgi:hypothetical protein
MEASMAEILEFPTESPEQIAEDRACAEEVKFIDGVFEGALMELKLARSRKRAHLIAGVLVMMLEDRGLKIRRLTEEDMSGERQLDFEERYYNAIMLQRRLEAERAATKELTPRDKPRLVYSAPPTEPKND